MPKLRGLSFWFVFAAAISLATLGGLATESVSSGKSAVTGIISVAQEDNRAMKHLDHLVNDIGSRPVDSVASLEAYKWTRNQFWKFGLENAHLERCGETEGNFAGRREADRFRRLHRLLFKEKPHGDLVPICNVVADIPGADLPHEYVIVGAHLDSTPTGLGATDNGTGVAAVMEAARILAEAGVQPRRTIRFILFGGEEVGLIGSRGYLEAHPEIASRTSAVYNMDHGANYIRGVQATAPMMRDMREAFAAVTQLAPDMPFEIEEVDYLPTVDPDCCPSMSRKLDDGKGTTRVDTPWSGGGAGACGSGGEGKSSRDVTIGCQSSGGTASEVNVSSEAGAADGETGVMIKTITGDGDTVIRHVVVPGAADGCANMDFDSLDLEALGISPEELLAGDGKTRKMVAIGSSDHAAFLAAGIPAFWWTQEVSQEVPYYAHSSEDTYDKVPARYLEHSAAVIALGALGTANLDHMISRKVLTRPAGTANAAGKVTEGIGCGSSSGGESKKTKSKSTSL
jgi:hypothetical protein